MTLVFLYLLNKKTWVFFVLTYRNFCTTLLFSSLSPTEIVQLAIHPIVWPAQYIELRLRVGSYALSGKKKELREQGVKNSVLLSICL